LGGVHPSLFIKETANHPLIDIACYGEGEITMNQLVNNPSLSEVKGIAYKKDDEIIVNEPQELHDPTKAPLFNWNLMSKEVLENLDLIPSLTSRGCPHRCTFCINAILRNEWRPRIPEQVLKDLEIIKNKECFKNKNFVFGMRIFLLILKELKKLLMA